MIVFDKVIERVKESLKVLEKSEKIRDKDIAIALQLDPQYFAVIKKRKKIPYDSVAIFCQKHYISINWILLGQKPKYINT